tara:strand:- start:1834 stop:2610 length:777 start_codon:yes stop_codon:yes gene_type:complete
MKKKIIFSIITPVLNREKFIKKNIDSVKRQSFKNYEHIIIDGKSRDKTVSIIKKNKNKKTILLSKKDRNLWEAINKGIKISKGEIIGILNSDDYYYKDALKNIYKYFKKDNSLSYIFGSVKKHNRILYKLQKNKIFYKFNVYPSHSVSFFTKKKIHKEIGLYNINYDLCADYDLFYKLFTNKKFKGTNTKKNEIIGYFQSGGISEKISKFKKIIIEFKIRLKNKQNMFFLVFLFQLTVLNILRNFIINLFKTKKYIKY